MTTHQPRPISFARGFIARRDHHSLPQHATRSQCNEGLRNFGRFLFCLYILYSWLLLTPFCQANFLLPKRLWASSEKSMATLVCKPIQYTIGLKHLHIRPYHQSSKGFPFLISPKNFPQSRSNAFYSCQLTPCLSRVSRWWKFRW